MAVLGLLDYLLIGFVAYWTYGKYYTLCDQGYGTGSSLFWSLLESLVIVLVLFVVLCVLLGIVTAVCRIETKRQQNAAKIQKEVATRMLTFALQAQVNAMAQQSAAAAAVQLTVAARPPISRDRIVPVPAITAAPAAESSDDNNSDSTDTPASDQCCICLDKCSSVAGHAMIDVSLFGSRDRMTSFLQKKTVITDCKHVFHFRCLNTWLETSKYCPVCRGPLNFNNCEVALSMI